MLLNFSSDATFHLIPIHIFDDQLAESVERFTANLELLTNNDRVSIAPDTATVDIIDNDGKN